MNRIYCILYLLYDSKINKTTQINTEDVSIIISQGDINYLTGSTCGRRVHKVYASGCLNRNKYEDFINECIRPCLAFKDSDRFIEFI